MVIVADMSFRGCSPSTKACPKEPELYVIDGGATPFAINTGLLTIFFDVYDGSPMEDGQYVESGQVFALFASRRAPLKDLAP